MSVRRSRPPMSAATRGQPRQHGQKSRLQVGQPPQQVGQPVASKDLLEGLGVLGVGQQDRLGKGTAGP